MYKIVKMYYDKGIYTKENVAVFVKAGKITAK
ncbi:MAG: XkdX family protein [Lachnospiraceae bacterium]|nr:XkdX family protein [Lachnospiraceae bacterium]